MIEIALNRVLSYLKFPRQISWAAILTTLVIVAVCSLVLSTLYSIIGKNSLPILVDFWYTCAIDLIPIIALLAAVWLVFLIVYAPIACAASVKRLSTPRKKPIAEVIISAWRYLILARCIHFLLAPILTERLRTLTHLGLPNHLALGWNPGVHPHLA